MKTYLFIHDVEVNQNELIIKIEPLYCAERDSDQVMNVNNKEYIPTKGDKLYFLPGVNIPRVKLKDLSLQHGIKTVRDIDEATHVFCGKNTKDKLVNSHWYYDLDTQLLRDIVDNSEGIMDDHYRENLRQALEFYTEPIVIVEYSSASTLRNSSLDILDKITGNILRSSNVYYTVDDEHTDLFPGILNIDIYDESKLLKHINGDDAATIDETMFLQISDMFKSLDEDNHVLAMEIMANCNYNDSLLYLEMLFEKHSSPMQQSRTKSHVNFKSLLSYLDKNKNYMNTDVDDIMKSIINKNLIDLDKINVIMKYYGKEIAEDGGNNYFDVKSITLNEDYAKLLDTNYVHELVPDFIPENDSDMSEIHGNLIELNSPEIEELCSDIAQEEELIDEGIEEAFAMIERIELKSEIIALEESTESPEIITTNINPKQDDAFEWF